MEENNGKVYIQKENLIFLGSILKNIQASVVNIKNELYWNESKELVKKPAQILR